MVLPMSTFAVAVGAWNTQDLSFHHTGLHIPIRSVGHLQQILGLQTLANGQLQYIGHGRGSKDNMEHGTRNMKHGTWDMEHETWNMRHDT